MQIRTAMDPTGVGLSSWNSTRTQQPCLPYAGQPNNRPGTYGGSWRGVTCLSTYPSGPALGRVVLGGIQLLQIGSLGLGGTAPLALAELRTATVIDISNNYLQVRALTPNGRTLPSATARLRLALLLGAASGHPLTHARPPRRRGRCPRAGAPRRSPRRRCDPRSASTPPRRCSSTRTQSRGSCRRTSACCRTPGASICASRTTCSQVGCGLGACLDDKRAAADPQQLAHAYCRRANDGSLTRAACSRAPAPLRDPRSGTLPWTYSNFNLLYLSYNPLLTGPLPPGQALWYGDTGSYLRGTSIGLPRPLAYILMDIKAALDPTGSILPDWDIRQSVQPCPAYPGESVVGFLGCGGLLPVARRY